MAAAGKLHAPPAVPCRAGARLLVAAAGLQPLPYQNRESRAASCWCALGALAGWLTGFPAPATSWRDSPWGHWLASSHLTTHLPHHGMIPGAAALVARGAGIGFGQAAVGAAHLHPWPCAACASGTAWQGTRGVCAGCAGCAGCGVWGVRCGGQGRAGCAGGREAATAGQQGSGRPTIMIRAVRLASMPVLASSLLVLLTAGRAQQREWGGGGRWVGGAGFGLLVAAQNAHRSMHHRSWRTIALVVHAAVEGHGLGVNGRLPGVGGVAQRHGLQPGLRLCPDASKVGRGRGKVGGQPHRRAAARRAGTTSAAATHRRTRHSATPAPRPLQRDSWSDNVTRAAAWPPT